AAGPGSPGSRSQWSWVLSGRDGAGAGAGIRTGPATDGTGQPALSISPSTAAVSAATVATSSRAASRPKTASMTVAVSTAAHSGDAGVSLALLAASTAAVANSSSPMRSVNSARAGPSPFSASICWYSSL